MDPRRSPPWFCAVGVTSIFLRKIDDRGVVENSNFWVWFFFTVLTHFVNPVGPHWPQDGPWGVPTMIWRHNRNFHFFLKIRWPRGSRKWIGQRHLQDEIWETFKVWDLVRLKLQVWQQFRSRLPSGEPLLSPLWCQATNWTARVISTQSSRTKNSGYSIKNKIF